ncbi:polysaccharide biosynthesis protein [Romboutsia sp.]|uniref:polysaccharide biosynthesis protein n=1 Tax=Romboutsia sp. TaxID=1965302 RepID=UPI003F357F3A
MFQDKILLITGGTGSFGSTVLKKFIDTNIKEIRVFSRDEKKQDDLRQEIRSNKVKFYIGDTRDYESLNYAMKNVDYVFHAAALKQVPSCEIYPMEAVKTNILGSENVFRSAANNNVKKVILLSTDKAVHPVNAMGMSKSLAEKIMSSIALNSRDNETVFCATRYGNVMASRGSVIPLFVEQIKNNQDLTITDPEMTRYLMSLEDSVNLVLYALEYGIQGDIFVQKSPASTVLNLARALKELFKSDVGIKIIGTRNGEKKHETLLSREDFVKVEDKGEYFRLPCANVSRNVEKYFTIGDEKVTKEEDYNSKNTTQLDIDGVKKLLLKLPYIQDELSKI